MAWTRGRSAALTSLGLRHYRLFLEPLLIAAAAGVVPPDTLSSSAKKLDQSCYTHARREVEAQCGIPEECGLAAAARNSVEQALLQAYARAVQRVLAALRDPARTAAVAALPDPAGASAATLRPELEQYNRDIQARAAEEAKIWVRRGGVQRRCRRKGCDGERFISVPVQKASADEASSYRYECCTCGHHWLE